MFLLVPAHPGFPGQIPQSRKTVVVVVVVGTHIGLVYGSASACIDPEMKSQRSRSHGYESRHGRMAATEVCCCGRVLLLAPGLGLYVV